MHGTFLVQSGNVIVSQINSGMAESPNAASTQRSVLFSRSAALAANTLFHIETTTGVSVYTFKPSRQYSSILYSIPGLVAGTQ